jgi:CRP-like cAMP-binding protein
VADTLVIQSVNFQKGDIIFSEFEIGTTFYMIQNGDIELVKQFGSLQKTLDILHESDMFGEMALLENSPRSATAIALCDVTLLKFDKNNFESFVMQNPQITVKLLKMFAKRIYDAKRRFMILTLTDPHVRVADVLIMLYETNSPSLPDENKSNITLKTTLDNIARWAGLSLNEATIAVQYFNKQGFLEIFPDRFIVKNINYYYRLVNTTRSKMRKS